MLPRPPSSYFRMTEHLTPAERQAFVARTLSARDLLSVDRHLARCDTCAVEVARMAAPAAASGIVRRVERAGAHLRYEELEAMVDRADAAVNPATARHLAVCAACARELEQMRGYAGRFATPIARREDPVSLASRISAWFGRPAAFGAAAAALAVAIGVAAVWRAGILSPTGDPSQTSARSSISGAPSSTVLRDTYDRSIFGELGAISTPARIAYVQQDYATLAALLAPLAQAGDARAQSALGLLYAEGHGVNANPGEAERLFTLAADRRNDAKHNLYVLRTLQATNPR